ncbi:MAG: hypothetical protein V6Z81_05785 [Parvularculales bacterium]
MPFNRKLMSGIAILALLVVTSYQTLSSEFPQYFHQPIWLILDSALVIIFVISGQMLAKDYSTVSTFIWSVAAALAIFTVIQNTVGDLGPVFWLFAAMLYNLTTVVCAIYLHKEQKA